MYLSTTTRWQWECFVFWLLEYHPFRQFSILISFNISSIGQISTQCKNNMKQCNAVCCHVAWCPPSLPACWCWTQVCRSYVHFILEFFCHKYVHQIKVDFCRIPGTCFNYIFPSRRIERSNRNWNTESDQVMPKSCRFDGTSKKFARLMNCIGQNQIERVSIVKQKLTKI